MCRELTNLENLMKEDPSVVTQVLDIISGLAGSHVGAQQIACKHWREILSQTSQQEIFYPKVVQIASNLAKYSHLKG
jgi:hypothetical protein